MYGGRRALLFCNIASSVCRRFNEPLMLLLQDAASLFQLLV